MNDTTPSSPFGQSLPPDPEGMNDSRPAWAGAALALFCEWTGAGEEDALGDLLADLMHFCDRQDFDFDAALERARWHYQAETQADETSPGESATAWTLHFDRDGTEDIAVIRDSAGDLTTSRPFWLPQGHDPIPATLAAMRLMVAAPRLLEALDDLLEQTVNQDLKYGITLSEGEQEARARALAAIALAKEGS